MAKPTPESRNPLRETIYLAALLHDIGKFYQRADDNGAARSTELDQFVKDNQGDYCPEYNHKLTHKHVLWTAQFLIEHEAIFKQVLQLNQYDKSAENSLFRLAVQHHKPTSPMERLIQQADHLASGVDRTRQYGMQDAEDENGWDAFKKKRMISVFEGILQGDVSGEIYKHRLPVKEIELGEQFFPKLAGEWDDQTQAHYREAWLHFSEEFKRIKATSFHSFADTLLALLQKYTGNIPSSTMHLRDVSLYDHLKTTASFAVCLYDYLQATSRSELPDSQDQPFLLVGGDLSGIQSYIYNILSKNAAKNLKGRSFYLHILAESVVDYMLRETGLTKSNVVYASGGGFYLLAPNTDYIKHSLQEIEQHFTVSIHQQHGTDLYLALDHQPLTVGQIISDQGNQAIGEAWRGLTEKLSAKKRRRYQSFLANEADPELSFSTFFEVTKALGNEERDAVSNEIIPENELNYKSKNGHLGKLREITDKQIELGKRLKDTDYLVKTQKPVDYWKNDVTIEPVNSGFHYYLINEASLYNKFFSNQASVDQASVTRINELDFLTSDISGNNNTLQFDFYGGNDYPRTTDSHGNPVDGPKEFDELAGDGESSLKRLGVLRMDVDNLGQIFIKGFNDQMKTFSRYSTLSRNLDYFFKGYLNIIREQKEEFRENTYILYAGGDDLFIVGKWNVLLNLADDIRQAFKAWTCYNPNLSLSGGMVLVGGKFPIAKAASMAEEAEKAAKSHAVGSLEKDAFTFLDTPMHWDIEFPVVKKLKDELIHLINDEKAPRSLIQHIRQFHALKTEQARKGENPSWKWLLAYQLARSAQTLKENQQQARAFLDEMKIKVFANDWPGREKGSKYEYLDLLNVAARWAEFELRTFTTKQL